MTCIIVSMIIYGIAASAISHYKITFIHESGVAILCGILISAFVYYDMSYNTINLEVEHFLYIFLPPILFAEGKINSHSFPCPF